jgi:DNA-binding FrmR family transcriptional regulator
MAKTMEDDGRRCKEILTKIAGIKIER